MTAPSSRQAQSQRMEAQPQPMEAQPQPMEAPSQPMEAQPQPMEAQPQMAAQPQPMEAQPQAMEAQPPGFWHGVFAGVAGLIVLVQLTFAVELGDLGAMYRELGDAPLPLLTRVTIHRAWMWGVPLAGAAAVAALLVRRPRTIGVYVALVGVLLVAVAASYYFPRAPVYALAGNIAAD